MKYDIALFVSIFWCIYGIIGLLGYQRIPQKFKGQAWTERYICKQGLSWLMLGVPWLIWCLITGNKPLNLGLSLLALCACSIPSLLFTFITDKKYKSLLKDGNIDKQAK